MTLSFARILSFALFDFALCAFHDGDRIDAPYFMLEKAHALLFVQVIACSGGVALQAKQGMNVITDADGAAVVLHAKPDDYRTDPDGSSGERIVCGIITR